MKYLLFLLLLFTLNVFAVDRTISFTPPDSYEDETFLPDYEIEAYKYFIYDSANNGVSKVFVEFPNTGYMTSVVISVAEGRYVACFYAKANGRWSSRYNCTIGNTTKPETLSCVN